MAIFFSHSVVVLLFPKLWKKRETKESVWADPDKEYNQEQNNQKKRGPAKEHWCRSSVMQ